MRTESSSGPGPLLDGCLDANAVQCSSNGKMLMTRFQTIFIHVRPGNYESASLAKPEDCDRLGPMTTDLKFPTYVNDLQCGLRTIFQCVLQRVKNEIPNEVFNFTD